MLSAYRLNEYEWFAAHSFDEAVTLAIKQTGLPREDVVDEMFASEEPESVDIMLSDEDGKPFVSVGDFLKEMTEPGFCFGKES